MNRWQQIRCALNTPLGPGRDEAVALFAELADRLTRLWKIHPDCKGRGAVPIPCPDKAEFERRFGPNVSCTVAHYGRCPGCHGTGLTESDEGHQFDVMVRMGAFSLADLATYLFGGTP